MSTVTFRSDIQGLRAIAVLTVMIFHFNPVWLPGGFIGVDIFFVISGFLITSILLRRKEQADYNLINTVKYFYSSRFKRIIPAYFAMLILVAVIAAIIFLPQDFYIFQKGLEKAFGFSSNNYFSDFGDYFSPANHEQPLLHTWSLAVEIQFYLLIPLLVLILPINWLKAIFAILLITLTVIAEYKLRIENMRQATYYSLYARLPEFFAGGLTAIYANSFSIRKTQSWVGWIGLLLIVLAAVTQPKIGSFPGVAAFLPVVGSVLLLIAPTKDKLSNIFCSKFLVWIGALSYSLYLWHWPVLAFLRYYTGTETLSLDFSILFIALTFLLSIISYYGIEHTFRSKRTRKNYLAYWLIFGSVLALLSYSTVRINQILTPEELPIEYLNYGDDALICHGHIVGDCLRGNLNSDKEVLVLGDSHAAMLNSFFDHLGKELNFKARIITASSCITIPNFDYHRIAEWGHKPCLEQIEEMKKFYNDAKTIFIAGKWNWHLRSDDFQRIFIDFLEKNKNANIFLISQEPLLSHHPMRNLRFEHLSITNKAGINPDYLDANIWLEGEASKQVNTTYLELNKLPIFDEVPIWNGHLTYYDEHHLNIFGAKEYARQASSKIKEAIEKQ